MTSLITSNNLLILNLALEGVTIWFLILGESVVELTDAEVSGEVAVVAAEVDLAPV